MKKGKLGVGKLWKNGVTEGVGAVAGADDLGRDGGTCKKKLTGSTNLYGLWGRDGGGSLPKREGISNLHGEHHCVTEALALRVGGTLQKKRQSVRKRAKLFGWLEGKSEPCVERRCTKTSKEERGNI